MITFTQWGKMGRLGNMMFQAATVIGLARKNQDDFILPPWSDANKFNLTECFSDKIQVDQTYTEKSFPYENLPSNTKGKTLDLVGYFQSWKYFEHCQDEIKGFFTPKNPYSMLSNTTGIHVRRGDYVGIQHCHPCLNKEYYEQAMQLIQSDKYIVFSDDIEYCKRIFTGDNVTFSTGRSNVDDLNLLAACEHQIIANSSFSWWGAYLNPNPNKIVVSPNGPSHRWFGPSLPHDLKDLVPHSWLLL